MLALAADRTVVVGVCKQCDLTHDPGCLYRIWHLPALPPLLCLVHLDSSVLGIGMLCCKDISLENIFALPHSHAPSQGVSGYQTSSVFPGLCLLL